MGTHYLSRQHVSLVEERIETDLLHPATFQGLSTINLRAEVFPFHSCRNGGAPITGLRGQQLGHSDPEHRYVAVLPAALGL